MTNPTQIKSGIFLFFILCFIVNISFAQSIKNIDELNDIEKSVYNFSKSKLDILINENASDSIYILNKDSLFMIQSNINNSDTIKVQIHLINSRNSSSFQWVIKETEYIQKDVYRRNPVFKYRKYFEESDLFSSNFAAVREGTKWGLINEYGELAIPIINDKIKPHAFGIWVQVGNKRKIYNLENNTETEFYDKIGTSAPRVGSYNQRLTGIKNNGKAGMINSNLEVIIPLIYSDFELLDNKYLIGKRSRKVVLINTVTGEELTPLFDNLKLSKNNKYFISEIKKDGKIIYGKVDFDGKIYRAGFRH